MGDEPSAQGPDFHMGDQITLPAPGLGLNQIGYCVHLGKETGWKISLPLPALSFCVTLSFKQQPKNESLKF